MLVIETRALGRKRPLLDDWSVDLPPSPDDGDGGLTLRELISRVVRAEVAAFRMRQKDRSLVRVLSAREIADGAARGRVDSGGRPAEQEVDEEAAVGVALAAFEDGLYLVILDSQEQTELDLPVYPRPDSRLVFLRVAFLAGA
jgi:hypothetical protein